MSDRLQTPTSAFRHNLDVEALRQWVEQQRWYASKSRHVTGIEIDDGGVISDEPPLFLALVQTRFATGRHELYQLPLTFLPGGVSAGQKAIATTPEWSAFDALSDPGMARDLLRRIYAEDRLDTDEGAFNFHHVDGAPAIAADAPARAVGAEQSNSSIVFGDQVVLKVFRKLEPGINPELELLQFLTKHRFPNIAPLIGMTHDLLLTDRAKRRKYGLPAELPYAPLGDEASRANNYAGHVGWTSADITVTTDADQTPIAPGFKVFDRTQDGRRTARFGTPARCRRARRLKNNTRA